MTNRNEFQDIANMTYSKVWSNCDRTVGFAVEKFHAAVTSSHSLTSKVKIYSLTSLIGKHLDIAVNDFMSSFLFEKPKLLSKLVRISPRVAEDYLIKAMMEYEAATNNEELDTRGEIIQATIDSLRDLVRFCDFYISEDVTYISNIEGSFCKQRTKKRGSSASNDLPNYLLFRHGNYCHFCDQPTEGFVEYKRVCEEIVDDELETRELMYANIFRENIENARMKGYSSMYCASHSPEQNKTNYNKAFEKKVLFYSVMRLIVDIRKRIKIQPLDDYELRVVAYLLLESYPDKNDLTWSVTYVERLYVNKEVDEKKAALIEMARLYQAYMEWCKADGFLDRIVSRMWVC